MVYLTSIPYNITIVTRCKSGHHPNNLNELFTCPLLPLTHSTVAISVAPGTGGPTWQTDSVNTRTINRPNTRRFTLVRPGPTKHSSSILYLTLACHVSVETEPQTRARSVDTICRRLWSVFARPSVTVALCFACQPR